MKPLQAINDSEFRFGLKQRLYNWNMRNAREGRGWFQRQLAEATGINKQAISFIETLRNFPKPWQAERIAQALDLPIERLFPDWLREFRLTSVPRSAEDESVSLSEAMERGLLRQRVDLLEQGWEDEVERQVDLKRLIPEVLESLSPRERKVLSLRFGLEDGISRTLREVAAYFGFGTAERVRQIEAKALRKLRHPSLSKKLGDLLD